jgi:glycosyltransferase involved in cell wall biosynthesis
MKVLLDIHALGRGVLSKQAQRGIYRYVQSLTDSIALRREIDLSLCASDKWQFVSSCRDYLRQKPGLAKIPFVQDHSPFDGAVIRRFKTFDHVVKYSQSGLERLLVRVFLREPARALVKLRSRSGEETLPAKSLLDYDIYFSPNFAAMPDVMRKASRPRNFSTVHDIIPVIAPEFVSRKENQSFGEKLKRLNREDWIFTISNHSRDDLCNYADNVDPDRVIVNPLAASSSFYECRGMEINAAVRKKYGIPPDGNYLLSLGALEKRKNLPVIFDAFEGIMLQEKVKDLTLVLVGHETSCFVDTLRDLPSYRSIRNHVVFTGFVPDEDLSPLYSNAAAFLFPSLYEGFGLPPLEAMQCGVPVVSSNSSSLPEVVGDAGILVAPCDSEGMAEAVLRILGDVSYREKLSVMSVERARRFSWEGHAETTVKSFKRALV